MSNFVALLYSLLFLVAFATTKPVLCLTSFSIDLIHRDSPNSPLYDSSLSNLQRVVHALKRSSDRIKYLHALVSEQSLASSNITPSSGDFTIRISVGTPPLEVAALIDTVSDIFWTQCAPQRNKRFLFSPDNSSSYKPISCDSTRCHALDVSSCKTTTNNCQYMSTYLDGPARVVDLRTDVVALGNMLIPNAIFGCGQNVDGLTERDWSGIVGLGGGQLSLMSQMSSSTFSYCLAHEPSGKSTINFGISRELSGTGVVTTPLVQMSPRGTFYYVSLQGISISNKRLDGHESAGAEFTPKFLTEGNMIIDIVSLMTTIPSSLYQWLDYTLRYEMNLVIVPDPTQNQNLCFTTAEAWSFPIITLQFKNADIVLNSSNYFVQTGQSIFCLAIRSSMNNDVGILGNLAQRNLLVGYDLESKTVSFKPSDCSSDH